MALAFHNSPGFSCGNIVELFEFVVYSSRRDKWWSDIPPSPVRLGSFLFGAARRAKARVEIAACTVPTRSQKLKAAYCSF